MARKDSKLDQLGQIWLFSACSKKDLTTIGRAAEEVRVRAGRVLTEEGAAGHEFYLILDGQASVKRGRRKVATLGPGGYFGELSLLDKGPRSATVVAETDMELLVLGQREFSGLLGEAPSVAQKMLGAMATRLRAADAKAYH